MANPDKIRLELMRREALLLRQVRLRRLNLEPNIFKPFEEVVISWDVNLNTDQPNNFKVQLNRQDVQSTGTKTETLINNRVYDLFVVGAFAGRKLGTRTAALDETDVTNFGISESSLEFLFVQQLNQQIASYPDVSVRSTNGILKIDSLGIHLKLYLKVAIEDYANPNIDISLNYTVGVKRKDNAYLVDVKLHDKSIDVWFSTGQHILSIGTAIAVQNYAEQFLKSFVLNTLASEIGNAIEEGLNEFADVLTRNDQRLFNVVCTTENILFYVYNLPPEEDDDDGGLPTENH